MKLAIITDAGDVVEVLDALEDYNLDKTMARAHIMNEIQATRGLIPDPKTDGPRPLLETLADEEPGTHDHLMPSTATEYEENR